MMFLIALTSFSLRIFYNTDIFDEFCLLYHETSKVLTYLYFEVVVKAANVWLRGEEGSSETTHEIIDITYLLPSP